MPQEQPKTKHTAKDSVFTRLFREPGNALKLYQAIHPEDTTATEADCELTTLETILMAGQYNDLGMLVRDRLILLMEAQSTYCPNISLREFMYLAESYKEYVKAHDLNVYSNAPVKIPRPELYVIYTGRKSLESDTFRLSDLYDGSGDVELTVHIIQKRGTGDILDQYIDFCAILDEQITQHGRTEKTARETIRICLERGILVDFLADREKEVVSIMTTLFSQEEVWTTELNNVAKQVRAEGRAEGRVEGRAEGESNTIRKLLKVMSAEDIAVALGKPLEEILAIRQTN